MDLSYHEYGDKTAPLMVFLHGGGVSSWMWDKQIQYFSHYHCMTIDLPEQGTSRNTENFSIHLSAEKINKLIEKIADGKEIVVIGFSLGAQVAIQMLSDHPNLINYAFINSALVRPNVMMKRMIKPFIKALYPLVKIKSFSILQAKTLYIGEEYLETYYKESSQMKSDTLVRILEENMSFKIPDGFAKAESRILVTVGAKEKAMMRNSVVDLVSSNSNCTGIVIPDVGHGISLVDPDFFNRMIEEWIQDAALPKNAVTLK
ncbi:alpha/beta fold hydrolase [Jeotgalibacillus malaysiensis]|uniref:alpha/beta fold hydrolase n=1 Tax=Jeotgalibacillus malaysiensis TaxID=1508404 RepID=UPI0038512064